MISYQFDLDTKVELLSNGRYRTVVNPGWNIGDNPNGGYLISIVDSAIRATIIHPDPVSLSTHFLRPGVAGEECDIVVEVVRAGRRTTTIKASLWQEGKSRLEVLATYSDLAKPVGLDSDISVPQIKMPEPDSCIPRTGDLQGIDIALIDKLDVRLQPEFAAPSNPEIAGWVRHRDGRPSDIKSLLLFTDCFPPSPLGALGTVGWVPSVELTIHVRRRPVAGWIKASLVTDDLTDGWMIESGLFWDSAGFLVAESRQLAIVRG